MNQALATPTLVGQYIIGDRYHLSVSRLPPNIDPSEDRDVHPNAITLNTLLQEILPPALYHTLLQENDRLRTEKSHLAETTDMLDERCKILAEENEIKQLLINKYHLNLQQARERQRQSEITEKEKLQEQKKEHKSVVDRLVSEKRELLDKIKRLECSLRTNTDTLKTQNLMEKNSGQSEVVSPLSECQKAMDSQVEMESSSSSPQNVHSVQLKVGSRSSTDVNRRQLPIRPITSPKGCMSNAFSRKQFN